MSLTAARLARPGLTDDPEPAPRALDDITWRRLVDDVERHRLVGLLAATVRRGGLELTGAQLEELAGREEAWHAHALQMERLLLRAIELLDADGVQTRVIKGPALAHTAYTDPGERTFGDIDIIVAGADLARARRTLVTGLGAADLLPEMRPGFDAEFAKDVLLRLDLCEIDLHRTLAAGPFGLRIPVEELFDHPTAFVLGATSLATLSPAATLLQVAYNAALGDVPPKLASLRDIAMVEKTLRPDLAEIEALTRRWGAQAVVRHAVTTAWRTFDLPPTRLLIWAQDLRPSALDRQLLRASIAEHRSYTRHLAALMTVPGVGAKRRYLSAILHPGPEYLDARGWTQRSHIARALSRLRPAPSR
jgi:hypothetical protein